MDALNAPAKRCGVVPAFPYGPWSFYGVLTEMPGCQEWISLTDGVPGPDNIVSSTDAPMSESDFYGGPVVLNLYQSGDWYLAQSQVYGLYTCLESWAVGLEASPEPDTLGCWQPTDAGACQYDGASRRHTYSGGLQAPNQDQTWPFLNPVAFPYQGDPVTDGAAIGLSNVAADFQITWYTLADVLANGSSTFTSPTLPTVLLHFRYADLRGLDLSAADFSGSDFTQANLAHASFKGRDLSGAILTGAKLSGTKLSGALLQHAVVTDMDLRGVVTDTPALFYRPPMTAPSPDSPLTSLAGCHINQSLLGSDWSLLDLTTATVENLASPLSAEAKPLTAKYSNLANTTLLAGGQLAYATFDDAVLDGVSLTNATLTEATFRSASMHGVALNNAQMEGADLSGAQLGSISKLFTLPLTSKNDLDAGPQVDAALVAQFAANHVSLSSAATIAVTVVDRVWTLTNDPAETYLIRLEQGAQDYTVYAVLSAATSLVGAYLPGATLTGVNLYGVDASNVQFYGDSAQIDGSAILEDVALNGSNLSNVDFTDAQMLGANLSDSHLFNAVFRRANLTPSAAQPANLSGTNLQGANFQDAQLQRANLTDAAVGVAIPTRTDPQQGGVYLFSMTAPGGAAELDAAATAFSLNPNQAPPLHQLEVQLNAGNLSGVRMAFAENGHTLSQAPTVAAVAGADPVWQITDGTAIYTVWAVLDDDPPVTMFAGPALTATRAAFLAGGLTLREQATVTVDTPGQIWLVDNDSENQQNTNLGYVEFVVVADGTTGVLDVYGTQLRIERLGDGDQTVVATEPCNVTTISASNMNADTYCPNGFTLAVNQSAGPTWDPKWLRAKALPKPPTCVPGPSSYCPSSGPARTSA
jgi:uncharacterized protein YjbI with pentapeptide repeats